LFMTEKETLGSLAEGCDFTALANKMDNHWKQMNSAEKTATIVSFKDGAVSSWVPLFPSQESTRSWRSPRKMIADSIPGSVQKASEKLWGGSGGGGEASCFPDGGLVSFRASATETQASC
jgi:hypothetical protein